MTFIKYNVSENIPYIIERNTSVIREKQFLIQFDQAACKSIDKKSRNNNLNLKISPDSNGQLEWRNELTLKITLNSVSFCLRYLRKRPCVFSPFRFPFVVSFSWGK